MAVYILKRRNFSRWDETDNLKRMKDSDILAEKKRKTSFVGSTLRSAASGAIIAGAAGSVLGGIAGKGNGNWLNKRLSGFGSGAKHGMIVGALGGGLLAQARNKKEAEDNAFYNKRLAYAQRQARRRERADWKTNMTQRDGYSY